jgi:hypothetical protein
MNLREESFGSVFEMNILIVKGAGMGRVTALYTLHCMCVGWVGGSLVGVGLELVGPVPNAPNIAESCHNCAKISGRLNTSTILAASYLLWLISLVHHHHHLCSMRLNCLFLNPQVRHVKPASVDCTLWPFNRNYFSSRASIVGMKMEAAWTSETLIFLPQHYTASQPGRPRSKPLIALKTSNLALIVSFRGV